MGSEKLPSACYIHFGDFNIPFHPMGVWYKKTIDYTCGGEVELCKKTRDGNLLVKTKNPAQTSKLQKRNVMRSDMPIKVEEQRY